MSEADSVVTRKKLLYKTKVDYQIGADGNPINDYALNHVLGCSHGCKYPCYAQGTAVKSGNVESYEAWCKPRIVTNTVELLERELKMKDDIRRVHLCFTTDPFPYLDIASQDDDLYLTNCSIGMLSMDIIRMINAAGIPVTVLTKGILPTPFEEDHLKYQTQIIPRFEGNYFGISLVSLNENFRQEFEPNTASYARRITALKKLHDTGEKTWVSMEPFPALTDRGHWELYGLDELVFTDGRHKWARDEKPDWYDYIETRHPNRVDDYGVLEDCLRKIDFVDRIVFGRWNYNDEMPCDVGDAVAWYRGAAELVRKFCEEHGIECVIKRGTE